MLAQRRAETSAVPEIQEHAIAMHASIAGALRSRDPQAARGARRSCRIGVRQNPRRSGSLLDAARALTDLAISSSRPPLEIAFSGLTPAVWG